jgi:hypothetical protein
MGGLPQLRKFYNFDNNPGYTPASVLAGAPVQQKFEEFKPESLSSFEIGYKTLINKKLLLDFYVYTGEYTNFISGVTVWQAVVPGTPLLPADAGNGAKINSYSISTNASGKVFTSGWGLSADYLLPNKLEEQIKLFKNKFVGAVFSNSLFFSKFFKKKLYTNNKINDGKIFYDLIKNYNISLDTVIFKTKAVKKLKHSLDSKFNLIHDLDLIIRLSNLFLIKYYPKVLSHWRAHWSSTSNNAYLQFANEKKIFEKKILNLYPLDKKLKKNLFFFKEKVYVEECIGFLLNGNNSKARIVIKKISKIKYKFLIYLLLNIPFSNFLLRLLLYVNKVILLK